MNFEPRPPTRELKITRTYIKDVQFQGNNFNGFPAMLKSDSIMAVGTTVVVGMVAMAEPSRDATKVVRRSQGRFGCKEFLLAASETSLQSNKL